MGQIVSIRPVRTRAADRDYRRAVAVSPSSTAGVADNRSLDVNLQPGPARLLAELGAAGSWRTLSEHRARYAPPPAVASRPLTSLIDAVERAGLRGRGGAGFPTARKLASVAAGNGRRIVVANGTEGEPASGKDRILLTCMPHLVIDGAQIAAAAVGADEVILCVDRTRTGSVAALQRALDERSRQEPSSCRVRVASSPPRYVAGEETALVNWLNGSSSRPTVAPPRPFERGVGRRPTLVRHSRAVRRGRRSFERGVGRRPTLVQNVETLAHITQIAAFGPDWFRQVGEPDDPGTSLFTVTGTAARPCVLEASTGTLGHDILGDAGGTGAVLVASLGRGSAADRSARCRCPAALWARLVPVVGRVSSSPSRSTPADSQRRLRCFPGTPAKAPASAGPVRSACPIWRG